MRYHIANTCSWLRWTATKILGVVFLCTYSACICVCVSVCVLIEDDLSRKIFHTVCLLKTQNQLFLLLLLAKQTTFSPWGPVLCNIEPRQLTCSAHIVSQRSSLKAPVQLVHHIPPEIPQATHVTFSLQQNTELHPLTSKISFFISYKHATKPGLHIWVISWGWEKGNVDLCPAW